MRNSSSIYRIKKKKERKKLTFKRSRKQLVHNKSPASSVLRTKRLILTEVAFFFQQKRSFSEFGTDSIENLVS